MQNRKGHKSKTDHLFMASELLESDELHLLLLSDKKAFWLATSSELQMFANKRNRMAAFSRAVKRCYVTLMYTLTEPVISSTF